jgi:hypothetical protein
VTSKWEAEVGIRRLGKSSSSATRASRSPTARANLSLGVQLVVTGRHQYSTWILLDLLLEVRTAWMWFSFCQCVSHFGEKIVPDLVLR